MNLRAFSQWLRAGQYQRMPALVGALGFGSIASLCLAMLLPRIEQDLQQKTRAELDALMRSNVSVAVDGRDVILQGTVEREQQQALLMSATRAVEGVGKVHNNLHTLPDAQVSRLPWLALMPSEGGRALMLEGKLGNQSEANILLTILQQAHPQVRIDNRLSFDEHIEPALWLAPLAQLLYQNTDLKGGPPALLLRHNQLQLHSPLRNDESAEQAQTRLQQLFMGNVHVLTQWPLRPETAPSALSLGTEFANTKPQEASSTHLPRD